MSNPAEEAERLADVAEASLPDGAADELLGALLRVASDLLGVPVSGVSLVGEREQFFRAAQGLKASPVPRGLAPCTYAIQRPDEVMVVPDLAADPRFRSNPLVAGDPGLRFYAGAPLCGPRGGVIGTLGVLDRVPRSLAPAQAARLQDLARGISAALSLRHATREVHRAARTDSLTGALNRMALEEMLAADDPRNLGLLMIDLDGFKPINDTYGHAGGDRVLVEVASRLRRTVRPGDAVVRLGGDEFLVVMRGIERPAAGIGFAARIHAALAESFVLNGSGLTLRASIGFAAMPWHAADLPALMERADAALYAAKRAGRGITHAAGTAAEGEALGRAALEARLREAFAPGGIAPFHLAFQPIASLSTGEVTSAEALLRWRTENGFCLRPSELLPVIEGLGYSGALDRWVLGETCRLLARGDAPCPVAVNASASTFGVPGFDAEVAAALREHGLTGECLVIEMTENSLVGDAEAALANMHGLARIGVRVVLDDFGGGHGTLARLRDYPFHAIKIDRSLVTGCADGAQGLALMEAVADMAQAFSIPAVAEGVEDAAQLAVLSRLGVERAQGFLLSRPLPWEELEAAATAMPARLRAMLADQGSSAALS